MRPLPEKLGEKLRMWYDAGHRELPWRQDKEPYHVWLSEIMLQQTRVEAVKPYFERFMTALPTIRDLAEAPEDVILKLWEGLGYYNRVRNMQKAARKLVAEYDGQMPADFDAILALPASAATRRAPSRPLPSACPIRLWTAMCCGCFPGLRKAMTIS